MPWCETCSETVKEGKVDGLKDFLEVKFHCGKCGALLVNAPCPTHYRPMDRRYKWREVPYMTREVHV